MRRGKVVSIGGGTGQSVLLNCLRNIDCDITAIVAMADDGGSTGLLRESSKTPAPGDIRKCLVALAKDQNSLITKTFAHRMESVDNHALGNLVLFSLFEETGSFVDAIDACEDLLDCLGEVMPSTLDDVKLFGETQDGRIIAGQSATSHGPCTMKRVWQEPEFPQVYQPAVDAILEADLVILGPGSLFTSIIPNVLVKEIQEALTQTKAKIVFICPKADSQGETWAMSVDEYVEALMDAGVGDNLDLALLHKAKVKEHMNTASFNAAADNAHAYDVLPRDDYPKFKAVKCTDEQVVKIEDMGVSTLVRDFDVDGYPYQHNKEVLTVILKNLLDNQLNN